MSDPAPSRRKTDEQSIRARKSQLFEAGPRAGGRGPASGRSFEEVLRETPADSLPAGVKAMLWGVGAVVAALLVASLAAVALKNDGGKGQASHRDRPPPDSRSANE